MAPPVEIAGRGAAGTAATTALRELAEQALLEHFPSAGVLIDGQGDILYLHGRTGRYLELAPGESGVNNILKMARDGLRCKLTTVLHKVVSSKEQVREAGLRVKTNGGFSTVDLTVCPASPKPGAHLGVPLYLVILEEAPPLGHERTATGAPPPATDGPSTPDGRIAALREELRAKEEYLQATNEELETTNEELKSANEEMQSVNEELQSANEELETSKEELQSVNEELATVNAELQNKVADLTHANNDMNNLLAGTGIGTVFVDRHLRILRFTPAATQVINLIPSDVGRPVAHIVSNLVDYNRLVADTQTVLDTLVPQEAEVQTQAGAWYTMRVRPYRTLGQRDRGGGAHLRRHHQAETDRKRHCARPPSSSAPWAAARWSAIAVGEPATNRGTGGNRMPAPPATPAPLSARTAWPRGDSADAPNDGEDGP